MGGAYLTCAWSDLEYSFPPEQSPPLSLQLKPNTCDIMHADIGCWLADWAHSHSCRLFTALPSQERSTALTRATSHKELICAQINHAAAELWSLYLWLTSAAAHLPQAQRTTGLQGNCFMGFVEELFCHFWGTNAEGCQHQFSSGYSFSPWSLMQVSTWHSATCEVFMLNIATCSNAFRYFYFFIIALKVSVKHLFLTSLNTILSLPWL